MITTPSTKTRSQGIWDFNYRPSSSAESFFRVMTPDGAYVEDLPLRYYFSGEITSSFTDVAGLALDPVSRVVWVARRAGRVVPVEGIF